MTQKTKNPDGLRRRTFLQLAGASAVAGTLARPAVAQGQTTVRWWYHYDNPQNTPAALVAKFEAANPGIKVQAEAIPWGGGTDYINRMFSSVVAGNQPDCAMVRLSYLSRFAQMKALEPLDGLLANWAGKSDISDDVWKLNRAPDGKQYYMPLHYVVIYLYYRQDLFQQAGLQPPKTFDEFLTAAKALTKRRNVRLWHARGRRLPRQLGSLRARRRSELRKGRSPDGQGPGGEPLVHRARHQAQGGAPFRAHRRVPPDRGQLQGRPYRDGHPPHRLVRRGRGSAGRQGFGCSAARAADGGGWTYFGDESNAIFSASKNKEAAFRWISFLSSAEGNVEQAKLSGQLPITTSAAQGLDRASQAFCRCELCLAADRPDAA